MAEIKDGSLGYRGQVGGVTKVIDVTLSLDTAVYADGDVLADTQEVARAVRAGPRSGLLQSVVVVDKDDQGAAMDLYVLDSNVSLGTENSGVSISDANAAKILGKVAIAAGDYYDMGGVRVAAGSNQRNLAIPVAVTSGTSLYLGAVSRGTGTYTASGVVVRLGFLQD